MPEFPIASLSLTVLLGVLIALTPLGTDSYVPVLPAVAADLGAPVAATQLTVTSFFLGIAAGQLCWGPVSDRYGRKPALIAGLGLAFAASVWGVWAGSVQELVLVRLAQGLGLSAGPVAARAIVRDLVAHEQAARLLARMSIVFAVVPIGAPLLGSLLLVVGGWQAVFWAVAAISVGITIAVARIAETAPRERPSIHPLRIGASFLAILGERRFVAPFLVMLSAQVGIFAFVSSSSFTLVQGFGVSAGASGALFALTMLGQIVGSFISSRLMLRLGIPRMMRIGARLAFVSGIAAALAAWSGATHWTVVVVPFLFFISAGSFTGPAGQAAAISPFPRAAGAASSLMGAMSFAAGAVVSSVLGALFDGTARPMAATAALAGVAAFAFERWFARPVLLQWKA